MALAPPPDNTVHLDIKTSALSDTTLLITWTALDAQGFPAVTNQLFMYLNNLDTGLSVATQQWGNDATGVWQPTNLKPARYQVEASGVINGFNFHQYGEIVQLGAPPPPPPAPNVTIGGISFYIPTLQDLVNWIVTPIQNFINNAFAVTGSIGSALVNSIVGALGSFFSATGSFFSQLYGQVAQALYDVGFTIWTGIQQTATAIYNTVQDIAQTIAGALGGALSNIQGFFNTVGSNLFNVLSELEGFVVTELKYWLGQAADYIISALSAAGAGLAQIGSYITNGFITLGQQIDNGTAYVLNSMATLASNMQTNFVNFASDVGQTLSNIGSSIWTGFQDAVVQPVQQFTASFFSQLGGALNAVVGAGGGALNWLANTLGDFWNNLVNWLRSMLDPPHSSPFPDPWQIILRTLTGVLGVGGGLGISLMFGEIAKPLGHMGMSTLSKYFWEMADFKTVGGDVIRALQNVTTIIPLKQGLNYLYRPHLPSEEFANRMLFQHVIDIEGWAQYYRYAGWSEEHIQELSKIIYTEPSDRAVLNLMDTHGVPIEWIDKKLIARGYSDEDRIYLKMYANQRRIADELTSTKSAFESAFVKGYVSEADYFTVLRDLGRTETEIAWAIIAAQQKEATARLTEDVDIVVQAFRANKLTQDQFIQQINALPLVPLKAQHVIDREVAKKRISAAADKKEKQAHLSLSQIFTGFDIGLLDEPQVITRLEILQYTPEDSQLLLQIHKAELAAKEQDATAKAQQDALIKQARLDQQLAIDYARWNIKLMQARLTSLDGVIDEIRTLPLSDAWKNALINEAQIASQITDAKAVPDKPRMLRETEVYKAWKAGYLTNADVQNYLAVLGYSADDIAIKMALYAP